MVRALIVCAALVATGCGADGTCDSSNESCRDGTCSGDGSRMLPGSDCLECHDGSLQDEFTAAGTVFLQPSGGAGAESAIVRLTDADGQIVEIEANSVGNFFTADALAFPITAALEYQGEVLEMAGEIPNGGCNSCHACTGKRGEKLTTY